MNQHGLTMVLLRVQQKSVVSQWCCLVTNEKHWFYIGFAQGPTKQMFYMGFAEGPTKKLWCYNCAA